MIHGARPHYAPDIPFRVEHILLDLEVQPVEKTVGGTVTHRVKVVSPHQKSIRLDQIGLTIQEASIAGKKTSFNIDGNTLNIDLGENSPKPGDVIEFSVRYSVQDPKRGLYFTGPDSDYPQKRHQVWSQGQDEDSRYWFPTFDYPNQKATSEVIVTVPQGFTAVSNGALLSKQDQGNRSRFHYRLGKPHVTYLITLVVAEFEAWQQEGPRALPVQYFVAPGRKSEGELAFGNTPKMIEAFEKKTGISFPYEKYSQVAVQDFIFGGMENTSATTQTDLTLHDARAHLDFSSDPLVSHELAHQWFGDLLTCRDWSHGWLNEGFATFMERVWVESNSSVKNGFLEGGFEEAKYYSYQDLKEYLEDDHKSYRRPIVCNSYIEPIDLFDTHLYQKGGLVLNLIRYLLGEEQFWKSVQLYVSRHQGQSVETLDLIRAIEDATGRNLRRVFDEWVFQAGYPEFEVSYQWHHDQKLVELVIQQKQTNGQSTLTQDGAVTPLFHLPVEIELTCEGGKKQVQKIEVGEVRERVFIPAESKPLMLRFDRDHWIPKTLKFPRPKEMLLYQLNNDPDCMGRIEAIQELVKFLDHDVVSALAHAVLHDAFWGVQAEAADALAQLRSSKARDALIAALSVKHPKARRAVVRSLGTYKDSVAADAILELAKKDESYFVEAEATRAYAQASRTIAKSNDAVESFLIAQLQKPSYRQQIQCFALRALGDLPGIGRGERPRALDALLEGTCRGQDMDARCAAVDTLGKISKTADSSERARIFRVFSDLSDEEGFRIRMALISAIREAESPDGIGLLEKIRRLELDGRARRKAMTYAADLQSAGTMPESIETLRAALEKLEDDYRKLRSLFEEQKLH